MFREAVEGKMGGRKGRGGEREGEGRGNMYILVERFRPEKLLYFQVSFSVVLEVE